MPVNTCQKGKRVERAVVAWFRKAGFTGARRSQQYCGKEGTADVLVPELPKWHIESKGTKSALLTRSKLITWAKQVSRDCPPGQSPVILISPNKTARFAMMPFSIFKRHFGLTNRYLVFSSENSINVAEDFLKAFTLKKLHDSYYYEDDDAPCLTDHATILNLMLDDEHWVIMLATTWLLELIPQESDLRVQ